jgi:3-oxoacyl-(acyl-carrier-protein) synthase
MATLVFDTHKAVKALRDAGFDDSQAEAVTEQISVAIGENLASKDDLEKLELRLTVKVYAAVVAGAGLIKALDFLIG